MTTTRSGSWTDVGRRRQQNQDMVLEEDGLFAVADGMGGHAGGEIASEIAIATLKQVYDRRRSSNALEQAIKAANQAVYERGVEQPELRHMGTTLVAAALVEQDGEDLFTLASVGDSRIYLWRDGELTQLSDDHSLVGEMVRAGQLTEAEALVHPDRNIVTKVIGVQPDVDADVQQLIPYRGDRLLLCSDGLTNEVTDEEIGRVLRDVRDPNEAARQLVLMANEQGGRDNISVVVIDVVDDEDRAARASQAIAGDEPAVRRTGLMSADERNAQLRALAHGEDDEEESDRAHAWSTSTAERPRDTSAFDAPRRRVTTRVIIFVVALVVVLAGTLGVVAWYARATYYVGLDQGRVTIFKGRPGGLLWFSPTVEARTPVTEAQVPAAELDALDSGKPEPSLEDARRYVDNLQERIAGATASTTTSTSTTAVTTTTPPA